MSKLQDIKASFEGIGGEFYSPVKKMTKKLEAVRVFLFDWDGVFNDGMKFGDQGSPFGEADSMGINLLRLSYWLKHGVMPITGIITGATNEAAEYFAKREGLECCIRGFTDKGHAFKVLCEKLKITPSEVAFVFDDVLDLPISQVASLRFCIRRKASPLFVDYVKENKLCDYITSSPGGYAAVRECCELMIGLQYDYGQAVQVRMEYGEKYKQYLALRKAVKTLVIAP